MTDARADRQATALRGWPKLLGKTRVAEAVQAAGEDLRKLEVEAAMAGKGQPRTGGRKKGTPNKASAAREKAIAESGLTPLEYMLETLRDKDGDKADRQWAANAAAPYCHRRMPQAITGEDGGPVEVHSVLELIDGNSRGLPPPGSKVD